MSRLVASSVFLFILVTLEIYVYQGLRSIFASQSFLLLGYVGITIASYLGLLGGNISLSVSKGVRPKVANLMIGIGMAILISKITFAFLLLFQDVGRFIVGVIQNAYFLMSSQPLAATPARSMYLLWFTLAGFTSTFFAMLYGTIWGKYQFTVDSIELTFDDLPDAFDGLRIAQISDIHAGTFDSAMQVEKGVQLLKAQSPDIILCTGDLVNSSKDEIDPYIEIFSQLDAPLGMYAVKGNHDYYGLYRLPRNIPGIGQQYWNDFKDKYRQMGFDLLDNESATITKQDQSITIVGVENWGAGPFPKKGDLDLALADVPDDAFCILMSHDPTHWDHHVFPHPKKIQLTLSGHTHGMQFGINLFGWQWSPVKYRYKRWIGLYQELGQYLYVNRGFGFLAWPGRVGMKPEITVIELVKGTTSE